MKQLSFDKVEIRRRGPNVVVQATVWLCVFPSGQALFPLDCNQNGAEDAADIAAGVSKDCNQNGIPDECDLEPSLGFVLAGEIPLGVRPCVAAAADLNGDGILDLAIVSAGSDEVSILLGKGDGTFIRRIELPVGEAACCVIIRDLNVDGLSENTAQRQCIW